MRTERLIKLNETRDGLLLSFIRSRSEDTSNPVATEEVVRDEEHASERIAQIFAAEKTAIKTERERRVRKGEGR